VKRDIDGYQWDSGGEDVSILTAGGVPISQMFDRYIVPNNTRTRDIWDGGEIVVFGSDNLPNSFASCVAIATDSLPQRLSEGICFYSAWMRETGAMFWIQLLLDLGAAFLLIKIFMKDVAAVIAMATGVAATSKG
jgi:hypothetical protein